MQKETLRIDIKVDGANAAVADTKRVEGGIARLSGTIRSASSQLVNFRNTFSVLAAGLGVREIVSVNQQFEKMRASLTTVTGSAKLAADAFKGIQKFASETPFGVSEVTQAFIKLSALGLEPSEKALRSYGNTASAMGKDLNQMIEAVADAATGEFERLKEFGIKASQQNGQVSLTFRGTTTTIKNSADEIQKYLLDIGEVDFAGGMERQAATIDGALSNLGDAWENLLDRMLSAEAEGGLAGLIRSFAEGLQYLATTGIDSFRKAVIAGIASIEKAWIEMKATARIVWETIKAVGIGALNSLREAMAKLFELQAKVFEFLRLDAAAKGYREMAKAMRPAISAHEELLSNIMLIQGAAEEEKDQIDKNVLGTFNWIDANSKAGESLDELAKRLSGGGGGNSGGNGGTTGSARKLDDALQKLIDTLLPAEKATRDFEEALKLLDDAFFAGEISAERYDKAIEELTTGVPKAAASAAKGASKEIRTEFDQTSDWMAQSLTDAIMRGFENGKGFVQNFIATMKNWFSTLVLRPVIQATVGGAFGAIGMGAPGAAGASGMDMMGGLSNIGGMFGGGTSTSGMLNSGAVALGYNPAGAAGPTALFGGSGMGYGLAGLGGGLIGTYVGNGSTASQMGGSVGGMVGYGLGAGAAFAGTQLGMQLGAFAGPIGMVVGALIGTLIGSLISGSQGDKSPDLQAFSTDLGAGSSNIKTTKSGGVNLRDYITESAFGNFGIRTKHDAFESPEQAAEFAQVFDFAGRIENALSEMVGPETTEKIAAGIGDMMGEGIKKLAEEPGEWEKGLQEFLSGRFDIAFEIIGGNMQKVYQSIGDGALAAAGATVDLFTALDALANVQKIYTDTIEAQSRTLYENQQMHAQGLRELIAEYQGGLDATNQLSMALTEQAQLQIQLLAQIDAAKASIDANLGGTIENLTLRLLGSDEERYNYLRGQARDLAGSLSSLNDPAEIARIVAEINALSQQGIGLLSEEQLMGGMGQDFIDFLTSAQAVANAQLEETRSNIISQGQILQHQTDAAMSQLQAAQIQQNAANTMASAAIQFAQAASSSGSARPSSPSLRLRPL